MAHIPNTSIFQGIVEFAADGQEFRVLPGAIGIPLRRTQPARVFLKGPTGSYIYQRTLLVRRFTATSIYAAWVAAPTTEDIQ